MTDTVLDIRKILAGLKFPIQPELKLLWILRKEIKFTQVHIDIYMCAQSLSHVQLVVTPYSIAC